MDLNDQNDWVETPAGGESETPQNLALMFAREAQTLVRYRRFATTARHEGFSAVTTLFERLAQNQVVLVEGHLDFLRDLADPLTNLPLGLSRDNLEAALASELEEASAIYPALARTAEAEGYAALASWFRTLARTKSSNALRVADARDEAGPGGDLRQAAGQT